MICTQGIGREEHASHGARTDMLADQDQVVYDIFKLTRPLIRDGKLVFKPRASAAHNPHEAVPARVRHKHNKFTQIRAKLARRETFAFFFVIL